MPKYTDEDGNEIVLEVPIEELKAAKEIAAKTAQELEEAKKRLAGAENKQMNWQKLSTRTEAEIKALSARELELLQRAEALEEQQKSFFENQRESFKSAALNRLGVVGDEDRKKALAQYERLKDEAQTEDQIFNKMRDAVALEPSLHSSPRVNPLFSGGYMGQAPAPQKPTAFSDDLKDLASKMGLSEETIKKHTK